MQKVLLSETLCFQRKPQIFPISFHRCRFKLHKEHVDNNNPLAPCKLHHDPNHAREMLLLATSNEDQARWVCRLSKRIQKSGYKANSTNNLQQGGSTGSNSSGNGDGSKISPRWVGNSIIRVRLIHIIRSHTHTHIWSRIGGCLNSIIHPIFSRSLNNPSTFFLFRSPTQSIDPFQLQAVRCECATVSYSTGERIAKAATIERGIFHQCY